LYESAQDREYADFKIMAAMHGAKIEDNPKPKSLKEAVRSNDDSAMLFRDPKEYEQLSDEERAVLTLKMKTHWEGWANSSIINAPPGRIK
jgi:hypothetical protein